MEEIFLPKIEKELKCSEKKLLSILLLDVYLSQKFSHLHIRVVEKQVMLENKHQLEGKKVNLLCLPQNWEDVALVYYLRVDTLASSNFNSHCAISNESLMQNIRHRVLLHLSFELYKRP